jgi:hypothetical protein
MKTLTKFSRLSWKMKLVIFTFILWVLFWIYGGWVEQEFALGLAIGVFPVLVFLPFWVESLKKKTSDIEEYIWLSKYVRTKQKRKYARLVYPSTKRPLLKIGEHELEIIDISERGVKFLNDKEIELDRIIHGSAVLLSGKTIIVDGEVSWSLNREYSLLINPIPRSIISEEKRIISKV